MKIPAKLEPHRVREGFYASKPGEPEGAFDIPGPCGARLAILAGDGKLDGTEIEHLGGWEHVSVSIKHRIPNWIEMSYVKDLFWDAEDCVVQYHPPKSRYVNIHPNVLHLWRPTKVELPMPPLECI